jgi:hypothetical protein
VTSYLAGEAFLNHHPPPPVGLSWVHLWRPQLPSECSEQHRTLYNLSLLVHICGGYYYACPLKNDNNLTCSILGGEGSAYKLLIVCLPVHIHYEFYFLFLNLYLIL